mmetsp:Transcript_8087/g.15228  ORF Transcript_8087/g.15228 Transcript_8087/m.15228 type:complete len:424 (+) Transcript_8087:148-1419(+)
MTTDLASDIFECRHAILHPHQCLLTCYIPHSRVGAVIGRKGSTILHIQKEASKKGWGQIRLSVATNLNTEKEHHQGILESSAKDEGKEQVHMIQEFENQASSWTPVLIRGDPRGAFAAAKLLIPLLHLRDVPFGATEDIDSAVEMDDIVLEVPINRAKHSLIIGKRGSTIAQLSAENNVRIMVPHRAVDKSSVVNINVIQLEGELGNVEKCLVSMLKLICGRSSLANNHDTVDSQAHEQEVEVPILPAKHNSTVVKDTTKKESKFCEKTMIVPQELFSLVPSLGRIRIIGKSTNTVIRRKKVIEGTEENVENTESDESSDDEVNDRNMISSQKQENPSMPSAIHFIISGKSRAVDHATSQLQRIFTSKISESDDEKCHDPGKDSEEGKSSTSIATRYTRKSKIKGRYGRGSTTNTRAKKATPV